MCVCMYVCVCEQKTIMVMVDFDVLSDRDLEMEQEDA